MADIGQRFDDVLRNLAGQAGSLEALLGVFFSFLHRNTDFYVTFDPSKTTRAGMGFPSGKAELLLLRAFRSFPYKPYGGGGGGGDGNANGKQQRRAAGGGRPTKVAAAATATETTPSSGSLSSKGKTNSVDHVSSGQRVPPPTSKETAPAAAPAPATSTLASPPSSSAPPPDKGPVAHSVLSSMTTPPAGPLTPSTNPNAAVVAAAAGNVRVSYTEDGKQVPIGNGGVTPRYYWTQTVNEATVYVDVPPGTRSKDVCCVIQPRRLKLSVRGAGAAAAATAAAVTSTAGAEGAPAGRKGGNENGHDGDVIFDGELPSAVSREDSIWSLNDGTTVVISFEKTTKSWWKSVVDGDPEIDTSQVSSIVVLWREGEMLRRIALFHGRKRVFS